MSNLKRKKHLNIIGIIVIFTLLTNLSKAQTDVDALRYSRLQSIGSGRTMAVGGAFGALGGDFTVLSTNPAGIATYRHSEISVTPGFVLNQTTSDFADNSYAISAADFNLSNIGVILSNVSTSRGAKWKTSNFAVGTNRLANFDQQFTFEGTTQGSITGRYLELAEGLTPGQLGSFEEGLAYDTYLIDNVQGGSDTDYFTDADSTDFVFKEQDFESSGYLNELVISYGGNYMHKLYIGATLGIPFIRYSEERTYQEEDLDNSIDFFNNMSFNERLLTTGAGINLKVGMIYRVSQQIRLGAAVHTPTLMSLTDNYSTSMGSSITFAQGENPEVFSESSPDGFFEYRLTTPWRVIGSAALLIGKKGFITAEVESLNYGGSDFSSNNASAEDQNYLNEVNGNILLKYGQAVNFKLGGELVLGKLRLRGGYAIYGSPFEAGVSLEDASMRNISVGTGFHSKAFFADLAFVQSQRTEEYVPYTTDAHNVTAVTNTSSFTQIVFTFGFKFY